MNYLEISILFLFIGFLILFYVTNMIYNKCISENKEGFEDAAAKAVRLAAEAAQRAQEEAEAAQKSQAAALAAKEESARLKKLREAERASNVALMQKWNNTRDSQFGKFNSYLTSIEDNASNTVGRMQEAQRIQAKSEGAGGQFSDSTPVQLATLKGKLSKFYDFNKGRDASILDITNRMTKVNNILAQAQSGSQLEG